MDRFAIICLGSQIFFFFLRSIFCLADKFFFPFTFLPFLLLPAIDCHIWFWAQLTGLLYLLGSIFFPPHPWHLILFGPHLFSFWFWASYFYVPSLFLVGLHLFPYSQFILFSHFIFRFFMWNLPRCSFFFIFVSYSCLDMNLQATCTVIFMGSNCNFFQI